MEAYQTRTAPVKVLGMWCRPFISKAFVQDCTHTEKRKEKKGFWNMVAMK